MLGKKITLALPKRTFTIAPHEDSRDNSNEYIYLVQWVFFPLVQIMITI